MKIWKKLKKTLKIQEMKILRNMKILKKKRKFGKTTLKIQEMKIFEK